MSDFEDISEDLLVARVRSVDDETGKLYLQFRRGLFRTVEVLDTSEFQRNCVVTVNTENYSIELAPDELWDEESWVGVVHLIREEKTLVSSSGNLRLVPTRDNPKYRVGDTVEVKDEYGVVEVLSEKPLSSLDAPISSQTSSSRFKVESKPEDATYEDFGGFEDMVGNIRELVEDSLLNREAISHIGARPTKGILFAGPPGTGKTMLARIIASKTEAEFFEVRGPEIVGKYAGESETTLRNIFDDAAEENKAIIFLDEIDSIAGRRDALTHDFSRSVVAQLLTLMDGFEPTTNVLVIAATNRPDALDPALRRPGRFDLEIAFDLPDEHDREDILRSVARKQSGSDALPHSVIARNTEDWTPAELAGIWHAAARFARGEGREEVTTEDYVIGYEQAAAQRRQKAPRRSGDQTT